jgi:hypothetical protein
MVTFQEYIAIGEGLWLAEKNAVKGMIRSNPFPSTQERLKKIAPKSFKQPHLRSISVSPKESYLRIRQA